MKNLSSSSRSRNLHSYKICRYIFPKTKTMKLATTSTRSYIDTYPPTTLKVGTPERSGLLLALSLSTYRLKIFPLK